jgi:dephospho-CoA kinase
MAIRFLGLTGGIATGKSTVSGQLAEKGAEILCADSIYHQLIAPIDGCPSPLAQKISEAFPGVLLEDGSLNRPELGSRVFGNSEQLQQLGSITHPAVALEVQRQVEILSQRGVDLVFYDVPLLFERKLENLFGGIIVVWVPESTQIERLKARDGISIQEAQKRLASQLPIDSKKEKATWVIDNSGSPATTAQQVDEFWESLKAT